MAKAWHSEISKLAKAFGGDWTKDERETLQEIEIEPVRWRVTREEPTDTNEWNYPICIIEFVHNCSDYTEQEVADDWNDFWWCLDNTSSYHFRALRELENGDLVFASGCRA